MQGTVRPDNQDAIRDAGDGLSLPVFRSKIPWINADLQTVRNHIAHWWSPNQVPRGQEIRIAMDDGTGDRLIGAYSAPAQPENKPLVVLIHGLSGCEESHYMLLSAWHLLRRGYPVLRLGMRGAGASGPLCRLEYNAGRSDDLRRVLTGLPPSLRDRGMVAIGFSLGGNILLKMLGEDGNGTPLLAAMSVSAPIDLAASARAIERARNRPYLRALLRGFRAQVLRPSSQISTTEYAAIHRARNFYQIDDEFVAPRNGYRDADDYYTQCSSGRFLYGIRIPTVVLHSLDDPMVPGAAYRAVDWQTNKSLVPLIVTGGGHVGFHGTDGILYLRAADRLLDLVSGGGPVRRSGRMTGSIGS